MEHRVALDRAVVAEEFAVRPFRLAMALLVEIALDDVFGVGRHADVVGDALDHGERRIAQARNDAELVDRQPHHAGDMIDRMRADHEAHRRGLSRRGIGQVDRLQIARRDEIDAGLVFGAQHQPAQADIGEAGLRIDDIVDRGRDIGPAVGAVLQMHRQLGHVGVVAGQHHRLAGRLGARHFENLRLVAQPPLHFLQQLVRLDAERRRDPERPPMTLPTSSAFSGPAARNSTAFWLPSITSAMPARSTGSLRVSSSACRRGFR